MTAQGGPAVGEPWDANPNKSNSSLPKAQRAASRSAKKKCISFYRSALRSAGACGSAETSFLSLTRGSCVTPGYSQSCRKRRGTLPNAKDRCLFSSSIHFVLPKACAER